MPNPLKLVELDNEYLDLVEQLQEAEGVLSADLERRLDEITAMQVQKADTYIMAMKNFEAISIKVDEMKQKFMRQLNAIKREQERWKDAMLLHLEQTKQDAVQGEFGKVRKMFSQKVDDDIRPEDIDQKYLRYSIVISGVSLEMVEKLFADLGPFFKSRPGGYLRILKCNFRQGDNAPMAIVELVGRRDEDTSAA